ncbi:hypothetical protein [Clostridium intestinale]|uniref:Uncharacterized protein n=1 Tax=Clostridium intestinale TaxID=36845 RepID=A0A7D6VXW0_9CLOT|nr:hypothetical protein [Clostridium intestinale]QLY78105.1 hypothetical protein HZF06_13500 [Clostridium intestinale]
MGLIDGIVLKITRKLFRNAKALTKQLYGIMILNVVKISRCGGMADALS